MGYGRVSNDSKLLMRLLRFAFKRETAMPVLALTFASAASVALVAARIVWTGRFGYSFLVWNLFLAADGFRPAGIGELP